MMQRRNYSLVMAGVAAVLLLVAVMLVEMSPVALAQSGDTETPTPTPTPVVTEPPAVNHGLPIPSQAVVGRVVSATLVYWRPSPDALVPLVLPAGKTAWVLGVDASARYYKIIWADRYLWVPVEAMGPNNDDVWQGAPLPTEVVE